MRTVPRFANSFGRSLRRQRRLIEVSVRVGPHEVDSLQASSPETLRASVRPIYAHLPAHEAAISYLAVEEESLPFGLRRSRRAISLPGLRAAMSYLTGRHPVILPAEASHWAHKETVGAGSADRRD
jgi:hypothetical protein